MLAVEILTGAYSIVPRAELKERITKAVDWVIYHQKEDGRWNYSINPISGEERKQIDFHQGYILESIYYISNLLNIHNERWEKSLRKGVKFYRERQFFENGSSFWRWPKRYPVEIHNQAQGIITFLKLREYYPKVEEFASTIAKWTITNMQADDGHFYYQNFKLYNNKISYMRWSNAWMFLALTQLMRGNE